MTVAPQGRGARGPKGRLTRLLPSGQRPTDPPPSLAERVEDVLRLVADLERREPVLPTRRGTRPFLVRGRAVVAADHAKDASELVPPSLRGSLHRGGDQVHEVSAPVAADALALAKFDLRGQPKLRAHYVGPGLTLAVAPRPRARRARDGGLNAVRAHEVVSSHAPGFLPPLLAHGGLGRRVRYLVEEWMDGAPVLTSEGLAGAAAQILDGLARVHRGHGVRSSPLSHRWGEGFSRRWEETRVSGIVPDVVGRRVADLVAADRHLRISWTHGDLVASNVLRRPDGTVVLVDWEHSREDVIMQDGAKLHLFSAEPARTLALLLDTWAHDAGPGVYTVEEELLLAHARLLSRYPARRADLQGHPRARVYEQQVRRQAARAGEVLDLLTG